MRFLSIFLDYPISEACPAHHLGVDVRLFSVRSQVIVDSLFFGTHVHKELNLSPIKHRTLPTCMTFQVVKSVVI